MKVGDEPGSIVYKFDHIWVWMGEQSKRYVFHQDEKDTGLFYLFRLFGPGEKESYIQLLKCGHIENLVEFLQTYGFCDLIDEYHTLLLPLPVPVWSRTLILLTS